MQTVADRKTRRTNGCTTSRRVVVFEVVDLAATTWSVSLSGLDLNLVSLSTANEK